MDTISFILDFISGFEDAKDAKGVVRHAANCWSYLRTSIRHRLLNIRGGRNPLRLREQDRSS